MLLFLILFFFVLPCTYLWLIAPNFFRRKQLHEFHNLDFAHRGFWDMQAFIPENSMAAFQAAVERGLGIELDIHLTLDRQVVVFHDDTLFRMCQIDRTVESLTFLELKALSLQNTSEHIPLLRDVLALVDGKVPLLIELKLPGRNMELCRAAYEELSGYHGKYLIQSFNSLGIFWFKRHAPHILRGQLSSNLTKSDPQQPYILRFLVRFLLTNALARPDFISYKLKDRNNLSLFLNRHLFRTTIAVWTLKTKEDLEYGKSHYNIAIFEKY